MKYLKKNLIILNPELRHKMTPDHEYELRLPKEFIEKFNLVANEIPLKRETAFSFCPDSIYKTSSKRGETIASISNKYNVTVSVIKSYNRLGKKKLVQGKRLKIPIRRKIRTMQSGGQDKKIRR